MFHSAIAAIAAAEPAKTTPTTLSRSFTTMIILFFLLASGDRLLRGFVEVLPRFKDKRTAVEIATEIEENISGYLLTITMMNALVGVATGIAMKLCGLGDPILWGAMAFLLNYIPILGPMTGVVIFFLVGIVTFDWPWYAFVPAGIYLLIHMAEGETITRLMNNREIALCFTSLLIEARRRSEELTARIARLEASERVTAMLVDLYDRLRRRRLIARSTFSLHLTQRQIGDHLGLTAETINRVLHWLSREDIAIVQGYLVIIRDMPRLRRLARGEA